MAEGPSPLPHRPDELALTSDRPSALPDATRAHGVECPEGATGSDKP
jgi:hypothetical protein